MIIVGLIVGKRWWIGFLGGATYSCFLGFLDEKVRSNVLHHVRQISW